jgi:hypothetical protein
MVSKVTVFLVLPFLPGTFSGAEKMLFSATAVESIYFFAAINPFAFTPLSFGNDMEILTT